MKRPHLVQTLPLVISPWRQTLPPTAPVLIIAAGYGKEEAPRDDPSWQVWGLNALPCVDSKGRFRANLWFDLHQRHAQSEDDMKWFAALPCPLYAPDDLYADFKHGIRFPVELIEEEFNISYFACTFAYLIAYAMLRGVKDIGLYGVDLAYGTTREQTVEWACVSWWHGYAVARGVRFHLPKNCLLGRHPGRYGLEYEAEKEAVEVYVEERLRARWSSEPVPEMGAES